MNNARDPPKNAGLATLDALSKCALRMKNKNYFTI